MAEESSAGFSEQFKELVTQNEQRMKAIQEQIAGQWESQRKAIADLIEEQWKAQQKAIADLIEQQRSGKIADQWEAQRKAITDQVEQQWNAQLKAITTWRNGSGTPKRRLSRTRRMQSAGCSDLSPNSVCT